MSRHRKRVVNPNRAKKSSRFRAVRSSLLFSSYKFIDDADGTQILQTEKATLTVPGIFETGLSFVPELAIALHASKKRKKKRKKKKNSALVAYQGSYSRCR